MSVSPVHPDPACPDCHGEGAHPWPDQSPDDPISRVPCARCKARECVWCDAVLPAHEAGCHATVACARCGKLGCSGDVMCDLRVAERERDEARVECGRLRTQLAREAHDANVLDDIACRFAAELREARALAEQAMREGLACADGLRAILRKVYAEHNRWMKPVEKWDGTRFVFDGTVTERAPCDENCLRCKIDEALRCPT